MKLKGYYLHEYLCLWAPCVCCSGEPKHSLRPWNSDKWKSIDSMARKTAFESHENGTLEVKCYKGCPEMMLKDLRQICLKVTCLVCMDVGSSAHMQYKHFLFPVVFHTVVSDCIESRNWDLHGYLLHDTQSPVWNWFLFLQLVIVLGCKDEQSQIIRVTANSDQHKIQTNINFPFYFRNPVQQ